MARHSTATNRVGLMTGAAVAAAALTAALARAGDSWRPGLLALGISGITCVVMGALRRMPHVVATGAVLLGGEALIGVAAGRPAAVNLLAGPVLLVVAEAGFLTSELHPRMEVRPSVLAPRVRLVGALAAAGTIVAELTLLTGDANVGDSAALRAAGAAAAVLFAAALVALARRADRAGLHADD